MVKKSNEINSIVIDKKKMLRDIQIYKYCI